MHVHTGPGEKMNLQFCHLALVKRVCQYNYFRMAIMLD